MGLLPPDDSPFRALITTQIKRSFHILFNSLGVMSYGNKTIIKNWLKIGVNITGFRALMHNLDSIDSEYVNNTNQTSGNG